MSAAGLVIRIIIGSVAAIAVGAIGVFGFTVIEPFYVGLAGPPESLGWGTPGTTTVMFASFGILGLLLVLVIWLVAAPIQRDQRQQLR